MIVFDLGCPNAHRFEGWFQSPEAFEQEREKGRIACPVCGSPDIRRLPSAIHLARAPATARETSPVPVVNAHGDMAAIYQKILATLMANSEYVGKEFASEARKIHYMETTERSIRGEASAEEFEALREEGIEVLQLPVVHKEKLN